MNEDTQTDHFVILFYAHYDRTELQTMLYHKT